MTSPTFIRLRFAFKLSFAIVAALFLGFHLQLETPRWSVLTAAAVAAGPAFAAGVFHSLVRFVTEVGYVLSGHSSVVSRLVIIVLTIRAPVLTLMLCCLWAGVCTWISSLVRVENSTHLGLAGYTALIIIVTTGETPY